MGNEFRRKSIEKGMLFQGALLIVYKIILDYSFAFYQALFDSKSYFIDFSFGKTLNSWLLLIICFLIINKDSKNDVSKFALNLIFVVSIIPITTIYSFENQSAACFNCICIMFAAASFVVMRIEPEGAQIKEVKDFNGYKHLFVLSIFCSVIILIIVLAYLFKTNGLPTLTSLDFSKVYTVVRTKTIIENKYIGYLYQTLVIIIVPYLIAIAYDRGRPLIVALLGLVLFVMYLYSGNKTTLFSIAIFVGIVIVRRLSENDAAIINTVTAGLTCICLSWIMTGRNELYSFLIRRVLLVPASLKFSHFEYFSHNEKLGLRGTIIGKIIDVNKYYVEGRVQEESFTYAIGRMLGMEGTNCNTGVLIEGFDRFGYFGFVIFAIVLIVLFLSIRKYEKNTNHAVALLTVSYLVYSLNDGFISANAAFAVILLLMMAVLIRFDNRNNGV